MRISVLTMSMKFPFPKFLFLTLLFPVFLSSCAQRGFFRPRSEVISEAQSKGIEISSVEDDRERFFAAEKDQQARILQLISQRSRGEDRDPNYRIGPSDEIEINVFDVPELNITAKVRQSGFVALPLVGAVKASGLTEGEFRDLLTQRLSTFVKHPEISVFISHYGSQLVAVLGAVRTPGSYPLKKGSSSFLEVLSQAGGVSDKAGNFVNFVPAELTGLSKDGDAEARARMALQPQQVEKLKGSSIEVYLDQVLGTSGRIPLEIPVRGGDMVIVPEAGKVMVEGEVQKGGSYDLGQQMTLLGALAAAGGITYGAKVDEVEIIRDAGADNKLRLVLDLEKLANGEDRDVRLRNGDIVRIPSDSGRRLTQDTFEGLSRVINFGVGTSYNVAH